ncbi:helix-turn-helix domain-containing protein [Nocardia wallacei]|uniref:helix-turn-helix domain-containing protein n=1 Tax=Nocardia wallacei TaxID=480035 RepID=UPI00245792FB|nr:helix-turn-helix domain-containing protein [Nocardia wallacei]
MPELVNVSEWPTRKEVAARLKLSPRTLANWAAQIPPYGPPFVTVSNRARYNPKALEKWMRETGWLQAAA